MKERTATPFGGPPTTPFVTARAVLLGVALIVVNAFWQTPMSSTLDIELTDLALFCNVVTILFLLVLVNHLLRRALPRGALTQRELLTLYVMLATSTALNGTDMIKALVSLIANGTWYATPENDWANLFGRYLPEWLTVQDRSILRGYYEGQSTLYEAATIRAWLPRAVAWTGFTVALIFVMFCITTIVRRQWVRNERLTYPIAQLPLELTSMEEGPGLLRNRLMWLGFAVAAGISLINQIHVWYPSVPDVPVQPTNLGRYLTSKPWNAMRYMYFTMYPFAVGMAYLMPLDLIVSTWFFHFFWQFERVLGSAVGFSSLPGFPYFEAQIRGGWVALLLVALWIGRRHFRAVLRAVWDPRGATEIDESEEPIRYRTAVLGILIGGVALIVFTYYAGMSIWVAVPFFFLYFALATTITRIRAELGPVVHTLVGATPDTFLIMSVGTRKLGPRNLTAFGLLHWILGSSGREQPMPIQLEAFKFAERTRSHPRGLLWAIVFAAGVGSMAGFWAYLDDAYRLGVESYPEKTWAASVGFRLLESRIQSLADWQPIEIAFGVVGFAFVMLLSAVRMRFLWWPFHPVGFVISGRWSVGRVLFPLILASSLKWLILKFAGMKGYRRSVPFFLGLILGDFVVGALWATIGILWRVPVYLYWTG